MPPCSFCGAKVLPANVLKSERKHPVCHNCRLVLDEYVEEAANNAIADMELPEDKIKEAIAEHLGEALDAKMRVWEAEFKLKMDALYDQTIDELRASMNGESPEVAVLEGKIAAIVEKTLRTGIASMKPKPLARGRKPSDSKTSQGSV